MIGFHRTGFVLKVCLRCKLPYFDIPETREFHKDCIVTDGAQANW